MESTEVSAAASPIAPVTCHDFLERMRHPSAADFVKSIKRFQHFIVSFINNASNPEKDSSDVQEFLFKMEGAFRAHSLWAGASEEELESSDEGLEKYVMTKLYTRAFASVPEEVKHDEELSEKIALVQQFIQPENLDINPTFRNETSWLLAQKELQKLNMYKSPRDKLACILRCCKLINNLMLSASEISNESPPGADEFLPVLIYVTLKANPPQLHSNLLYIQRYRRQSRLVAEPAYYFTNMLSAEYFIANIDAKSLSMEETEYEKNMQSARAVLAGLSNDAENGSDQVTLDRDVVVPGDKKPRPLSWSTKNLLSNFRPYWGNQNTPEDLRKPPESKVSLKDSSVDAPATPVYDLEKKGAASLLKDDHVGSSFREYPYIYAHAGDLTVVDVETLLESYKHLVVKYVSLARCVNSTVSSIESPPSKQSEDSEYSRLLEVKNENDELSFKLDNLDPDPVLNSQMGDTKTLSDELLSITSD